MKINKQREQDIVSLLHSGYSINSILVGLNKKYKNNDITKGDILVIAKKYKIKNIGNRDINSIKDKLENINTVLPNILSNDSCISKIKKNLITVLIAFIVLFISIYILFGLKPMLITLGVVFSIFGIVLGFMYLKYIKNNKGILKKKNNKKK